MEVKLILSDSDYRKIMSSTHRIDGTMGVISPTVFDFRAFNRADSKSGPYRELRTRHGRTRITPDMVKLSINIKRTEDGALSDIIYDEADEATDFIARFEH